MLWNYKPQGSRTFIIECLIRRAAAVGVARRPSLQRPYKDLNRDFFDNSLPLYRVRRRSCRYTGLESALGFCDRATRTICVRNQLTPDEERHVVLHEMCHVATGPGVADHGPTFLRQLQRPREGRELGGG
jgi:hypothetical protein